MIIFLKSILKSLSCSETLSYWYNFGSLLGIVLFIQILSGLLLTLDYSSLDGFSRIIFILYDIKFGWFLKLFHRNNASFVFVVLYLHLFKNIRVFGYRLRNVWYSGLLMIVLIMGAGFRGYCLVARQIRFWAAIVITSLISVIPFRGESIIYFVWGGYMINWTTIQLLFLVHFILPFLVIFIIIFHLSFLHETGSVSSFSSFSNLNKIRFFYFYWLKDSLNLLIYFVVVFFMLIIPYSLGEVELFEEANTINSPVHIVPEFYFCCQYAILRSVPRKGVGVIIMILSIGIFFVYPVRIRYITVSGLIRTSWLFFFFIFSYLRYLGISPISQPFIYLSIIITVLFFFYHLFNIILNLMSSYFYSLYWYGRILCVWFKPKRLDWFNLFFSLNKI